MRERFAESLPDAAVDRAPASYPALSADLANARIVRDLIADGERVQWIREIHSCNSDCAHRAAGRVDADIGRLNSCADKPAMVREYVQRADPNDPIRVDVPPSGVPSGHATAAVHFDANR